MLDLERAAAPHNENNGSTAPDLYRDTEGTTGAVLRSGTGRFVAKRFGFEFHQTINQSEDVAGCDSFLLSFFVLFWGGNGPSCHGDVDVQSHHRFGNFLDFFYMLT